MKRRHFLLTSSAAFLVPSHASVAQPVSFGAPPSNYAGPFRVWGPHGDTPANRHHWACEIVNKIDGPFGWIRPNAFEWWDGARWVGTD